MKAHRILTLLTALVLCLGLSTPTLAAKENGIYYDPAENWVASGDRRSELDTNATLSHGTLYCANCRMETTFMGYRTPEYTTDGQTALARNVKYSDGTLASGTGTGAILDGVPGVNAYFTGCHWTKSVCETCGAINSNMDPSDYSYGKNVYWLYDCAVEFFVDLDNEITYEYTDSTYHTKAVKGGRHCAFCYGTYRTESAALERHSLERSVTPQPANQRFVVKDSCTLCGYEKTQYVAAKYVVADYYGAVDGKPHTLTMTDLSEAGVRTSVRYGGSADACTLTSAPNYTDEGDYAVYYEIIYTCENTEMVENGVAYVRLRDESATENVGGKGCACGCGDANCGCAVKDCSGGCCGDAGCNGNHAFILLDSVDASCLTLGYDRYLCTGCGMIEKRDYESATGHAWQGVVVREADCETDGKLMEICAGCGQVKTTSTSKGEHSYSTYNVAATCTSSGYNVRECTVCGDRSITDIIPVLSHNYVAHNTPASCTAGGHGEHLPRLRQLLHIRLYQCPRPRLGRGQNSV